MALVFLVVSSTVAADATVEATFNQGIDASAAEPLRPIIGDRIEVRQDVVLPRIHIPTTPGLSAPLADAQEDAIIIAIPLVDIERRFDPDFYRDGSFDLDAFQDQHGDTSLYVAEVVAIGVRVNEILPSDAAQTTREDALADAGVLAKDVPRVTWQTYTRTVGLTATLVPDIVPLPNAEALAEAEADETPLRLQPRPASQSAPLPLATAGTSVPEPGATWDPLVTAPASTAATAQAARAAAPEHAAAFAVAAVATAAFLAVGAALYTLLGRKDLLDNDVRARIHGAVRDRPGVTVAELADLTGVKHQTVCYHLRMLEKAGYVTAVDEGNRRRVFLNGVGLAEDERRFVGLLRDAQAMRILDVIAARPSIIKSDVAEAAGLSRNGAAWHVDKLVKHAFVEERKVHGHCRLVACPDQVRRLHELRDRLAGPSP